MLRTLLVVISASILPHLGVAADDFESTVRPILVEHCLKCHGPEKQKGGLRLDSRVAALTGGDTGPSLVPGKPDQSLLIKAINHIDLEMPPTGKMTEAKITALTKWVAAGAVWPESKIPTTGSMKARKPGSITDEDRKWWAFQPITKPLVPQAGETWAKTEIDRFIAEGHAQAKVQPAREADKLVLLRRVTFDLTGLPPTPNEIDAFLADSSLTAYDTVVDRLLNSPRYGERQARLWLDLVRYAESDGYKADAYRSQAWRYRDYVVQSFNADKPYDRFVQEQLAGDELDPTNPDALIATGYYRLPIYEYNQVDARGQRVTILNDITDVTGDVFLAMGVSCARCHDHKFDPILQRDYFSLQAFFAGLRYVDRPVYTDAKMRDETAKQAEDWEAKSGEIRRKMAAMIEPHMPKIREAAEKRFPLDVQAVLKKPAEKRTPEEQQFYDLAIRQIDEVDTSRAVAKLSADGKKEYQSLKKQLDDLKAFKPKDVIAMTARDVGPIAAVTTIPGGRKASVEVEPAAMTVLNAKLPAIQPTADSSGRRLALARWLTSPENPLTARVMVNRIWQQHFDKGLVGTPSDFGTLGDKPSHPALLDYLAADFVSSGWKLKPLHKKIVTSAVYRQASNNTDTSHDPDNKWLTRMRIRRLDAEQARDAMLATSGELKDTPGGPPANADQPRRAIYTKVLRNTPDPLLASLDAADGLSSCACRNPTVTPTQSLLLLNQPAMLTRAKTFAARVIQASGTDETLGISTAYRLAFGRAPTDSETADAKAFLQEAMKDAKTPEARLVAWSDLCHALMNANEFLYLD